MANKPKSDSGNLRQPDQTKVANTFGYPSEPVGSGAAVVQMEPTKRTSGVGNHS